MKSNPRYHQYALRLLRLYPQSWRERYADEAAAVLEEHPVTLRTLLDLFLGMLDAYLRRPLFTEGSLRIQQRVRDSQVAIFCSFLLFSLVWLASNFFYNLFWTSDQFDPTIYPNLGQLNSNLTQMVLNICGVGAVLALLIGALPFIFATLRQALMHRRWKVLTTFLLWLAGMLLTPALFALDNASYGSLYGSAMGDLRNLPWLLIAHPHRGMSTVMMHPLALVLLLLLAWIFIGGPLCLIVGARKTALTARQARITSIAALLTTIAMSGMLAAMAFLAVGLRLYAPDFMTGRIIALDAGTLWMALLTTLAYGALWRSLRARRALRPI